MRAEQSGREDANAIAAKKMAALCEAVGSGGCAAGVEVFLTQLLFCFFADSTGLFPDKHFLRQVEASKPDGSDLRHRIAQFFDGMKETYGSLFGVAVPSAQFDAGMRGLLLDCCHFDWGGISPAIFGAMFQGIMDEGERREIGAHYTSEENILKVIDPLFMDDLWKEFRKAKGDLRALDGFHEKIAGLKFLDPACGCGNFLMVAYRELRLLEIEVLKARKALHNGGGSDAAQEARKKGMRGVPKVAKGNGHSMLDIEMALKVNVGQFHGIEIQPWPCQIAKTGMWLMDHLMNMRASEEFGQYYVRLPLTQGATIVEANALRIDWGTVVPKSELSYILGNPPFSGARLMGPDQKDDMGHVFGDTKGLGNLDYVTAWYRKAADYMEGEPIRAAFVSTNSVMQGEQPAILWNPLVERGVAIAFQVPTFKWSNEARGRAAVHCVIVGFGYPGVGPRPKPAPPVAFFVERRKKPLCDVPEMVFGSMPNDGGHLIIEDSKCSAFKRAEPAAKQYIRRFMGSEEFINGTKRWCLWLVGVSPAEIKGMPLVMERVEACEKHRLASKREATKKLAKVSALFGEIRQPDTDYLIVPSVSGERRDYIPMGFMSADTIASNLVLTIPGATLYHFGVLTSKVHMAWVRKVCGRLGITYRYSKDVVYNNFPWPSTTDEQRAKVEELAQGVLDARAQWPDCTLDDLYDPLVMMRELRKAHDALDRAVMKLYGFKKDAPEPEIVAKLMEMYLELSRQSASSTLTTK